MKYTVFSINDTRKEYVKNIKPEGWTKVKTQCVDAINTDITSHYSIKFPARRGHIGIWMTVLNALEQAPIVTFEDDAILQNDFEDLWKNRISYLPRDFDFFTLFVPRDQDYLAPPLCNFIVPVYQTYGGVSMYYSAKGAEKIKALVKEHGFPAEYDESLYAWAKEGLLKGYTSHPEFSDLVYITGKEKSIVQESDFI